MIQSMMRRPRSCAPRPPPRGMIGLAVTVHLHPWSKHGLQVTQIMEAAGMAMEKLILNHLDDGAR